MIEENGIMSKPNPTLKQRPLLSKYEIPIDHLSYEYIGACKDIKELERILRILRSGEEGYYPDLQKSAEERLSSLSPNNRHLRTEEPALTKNSMNNEEWNNIATELTSWKKEITVRDLRLTEENNNTMEEIALPPVRKPQPAKCAPEKKTLGASASMASKKGASDYAAWDKYDVDTELLKMDLEDERGKEERQAQVLRQVESDRLEHIVKEAGKLSETERQVLAEQEKNRGNEYYTNKEYSEAIKYYTASIAIWPTAKAHNNRAACYLKQCKYTAALEDTTRTLEMEPDNAKALFRRSTALQHKNRFREALEDMNAVLRKEPKNNSAQHIAKELREQIHTLPKTVRIMTDNGLNKPKKVEEMCESELTTDSLSGNSYEVNEWGLPKVMCQCNGSPRYLNPVRRRCNTTSSRPRTPSIINNAKIVEITDETELPKVTSTKLEIVEVEKSEASEDFFKPKKCVVVDKRTQKNVLLNGNAASNITECGPSTNLGNGDSEMDEDFGLNCPLLEDSAEPVTQPNV